MAITALPRRLWPTAGRASRLATVCWAGLLGRGLRSFSPVDLCAQEAGQAVAWAGWRGPMAWAAAGGAPAARTSLERCGASALESREPITSPESAMLQMFNKNNLPMTVVVLLIVWAWLSLLSVLLSRLF